MLKLLSVKAVSTRYLIGLLAATLAYIGYGCELNGLS